MSAIKTTSLFLLPLLYGCSERFHYMETPTDTASGATYGDDNADDDADGDGDGDGETDDARVVSYSFPADLDCGESATGVVVIENTGNTAWTREGGFKLGAVGDEDPLFDSGDVRVWLNDDDFITPGEQHTFEIALLGNDTNGTESTDWQMVREGVHWFGDTAMASVDISCDDSTDDTDDGSDYPLPLPDMSDVVWDLADEHPEMLANSCQDTGGNWEFLDTLVERLREIDERWGYNWKRGQIGDASRDCVDYHYGSGTREGSTEVYIIDVIEGHCGNDPGPNWLDQTEATADAGTIGMWTARGQF